VTLSSPALALAAFALLAPSAAFADSAKVSDLVDDLQRIQVKIAQGDKAAYPAQLDQLKTITAAIAAASPKTWKDKREADSLIVYILSGGSLAGVAPLLKGDAVIESERSLARGALAYVTNHEADAIALFKETDLTALDVRLAGEVAFARSVLETKRDAKAAVELLDWSRLLAPGGLVEEAALRREIALLAEAKEVNRLAMLTRQYVTRFAASLYAADFLHDLAGAVARLGLVDDAANYKLVSSAVAALPPDGRREFMLTLAQSGVVSAKFAAAAAAATEALESSNADSPEAMRARLYLATSRLFSDAYDAAVADLRTLSASKLNRADAGLLAAARRAAAELRIAPEVGVVNAQDPAALGDGDKGKPSGPALTIAQAQDALQRTSSLAQLQNGGSRWLRPPPRPRQRQSRRLRRALLPSRRPTPMPSPRCSTRFPAPRRKRATRSTKNKRIHRTTRGRRSRRVDKRLAIRC
jgi:chemotaxis protein MotC